MEFREQRNGRIHIQEVVVAQGFAGEHLKILVQGAVETCLLVGIFAVPQDMGIVVADSERRNQTIPVEVIKNGSVVMGGHGKGFGRIGLAFGQAGSTLFQNLIQNPRVLTGRRDHRALKVVLGGGS